MTWSHSQVYLVTAEAEVEAEAGEAKFYPVTDTNSALFSSPHSPILPFPLSSPSPAGKPIAGLLPQGDRDEAGLRGGVEQPRLRFQRATGKDA